MKWDVFFSICQMDVDGARPTERLMLESFFKQVKLADQLGYETAWVAESHLSCEVQKSNPNPVIPHFEGEIGLNTDIFQLAHCIFAETKHIEVGSAIRNILCNGGPLAHAEALKMFLSLHALHPQERRKLHLGFASGRFPFSNAPYGILPRNEFEASIWPILKGYIFLEAVEIFLRALTQKKLSSADIRTYTIDESDFRSQEQWQTAQNLFQHLNPSMNKNERLPIEKRWDFDSVGVIPFDAPLELLELTIGSHDARAQKLANTLHPCGVFNLSITPQLSIEATHKRMQTQFHPSGGKWQRYYMPRTVLVFINNDPKVSRAENDRIAAQRTKKAIAAYWTAMQGTIDPAKIQSAMDNALMGSVESIVEQIIQRFHPNDRMMLWFDFNTHEQNLICEQMHIFMEMVIPKVNQYFADLPIPTETE